MGKFEFADTVSLEICGHNYRIVATQEYAKKMAEISKQIIAESKTLGEDEAGRLRGAELCRECIDAMLGDGAFTDIFFGRTPKLEDVLDIIEYAASEIQGRNATLGNRAQRRAAKK